MLMKCAASLVVLTAAIHRTALVFAVVAGFLAGTVSISHAQCTASFSQDIGSSMTDSAGSWRTYSGNCSGTPNCEHYFDLSIPAGASFDVSLCGQGGSASWDTTLGVYGGPSFATEHWCDDDSCSSAGPSEISLIANVAGTYRIRIGGFNGVNGPYTIAYRWDSGASLISACVDGDADSYCNDVDCDDSSAAVFPGQIESCDGLDNNCDGQIDEGYDNDGDGWTTCGGDCDDSSAAVFPGQIEACDGLDNNCSGNADDVGDPDGDGYTSCAGDCDSTNSSVYPGAVEDCNSVDDNCDGTIDDGFDQDADGWTSCGGDCNDSNPSVSPDALEQCNAIDDDCDSQIDEEFDQDGDGVTTCSGDCDDNNNLINPGATEVCDGVDDDCNGTVDDAYDGDGDGHSPCAGDCDDSSSESYPGALELCDGLDNDCNGVIDDDCPQGDDDDDTGSATTLTVFNDTQRDLVSATWTDSLGGGLICAELAVGASCTTPMEPGDFTVGVWTTLEGLADFPTNYAGC